MDCLPRVRPVYGIMNNDAPRYSETRYLHAKRSVDDRALNHGVLEAFARAVRALPRPLRVLELGAGVGTMVGRLFDRGCITAARYTLVDRDGASLRAAAEHLGRSPRTGVEVELVEAEAFDWLQTSRLPPFDAVVASAFLDLVDVPALLPLVWRCVRAGAPFWFSINFDGETIFLPELVADADLLGRYHRTMDERVRHGRRAGESRTGRHLLETIPRSGARVAAAGSSDWVVWPTADGSYPDDESYFLHHIVHTIDEALAGSPSQAPTEIPGVLASWVGTRHAQIDRGELCYIAHQLDVTGHGPLVPAVSRY
jgi:SAM-dependent methyltransferase